VDLIDGLPEKTVLQHTRGPGKSPHTAGTFRAAQVAGSGGFKRNGYGISPLNRFTGEFAELVTAVYFGGIPKPAKAQFGKKINAIVPVKIRHRNCKNRPGSMINKQLQKNLPDIRTRDDFCFADYPTTNSGKRLIIAFKF